ncbi:hypothetical protein E2I00_019929 [Balaenoptera physalus]|uniref:Translationally-controlled tumor protein n=1 Tax=Balaenoptera physalus TaxID=9770 RepID=A0A643BVC0_BALPH|nr:hypothetical protein E2I00_019929 [Balaenoptera physalus]
MFPDIYKFLEMESGLCLEVEGKMVSRTEGEGTESTVITGVDIVMNHCLQKTSFTKEGYKNLDSVVALLDSCEDGMTPFMIFFMDGLEMEKC